MGPGTLWKGAAGPLGLGRWDGWDPRGRARGPRLDSQDRLASSVHLDAIFNRAAAFVIDPALTIQPACLAASQPAGQASDQLRAPAGLTNLGALCLDRAEEEEGRGREGGIQAGV